MASKQQWDAFIARLRYLGNNGKKGLNTQLGICADVYGIIPNDVLLMTAIEIVVKDHKKYKMPSVFLRHVEQYEIHIDTDLWEGKRGEMRRWVCRELVKYYLESDEYKAAV